jgi:hypothetical protein
MKTLTSERHNDQYMSHSRRTTQKRIYLARLRLKISVKCNETQAQCSEKQEGKLFHKEVTQKNIKQLDGRHRKTPPRLK